MSLSASFWSLLAAGGGGLAFVFIVLLALGLLGLTAFYLASAGVVLERFARAARSKLAYALSLISFTCALAPVIVRGQHPESPGLGWGDWATLYAQAAFALATVSLLLSLFAGWLIRRGRSRVLGWLAIGWILLCAASAVLDAGGGELLVGLQLLALVAALSLVPLAMTGFLDLRGTVEWFIAVRYLIARRRQVFISAITAICVAGIAAGVWLIIVVLSVMNGFERTWREEIVGNRAHFTVHSGYGSFADWREVVEKVRTSEGVTGASPYLDSEGMVRSEGGRIYSVRMRGIDPKSVGDVTDLPNDMISGSLAALTEPNPDGEAGDTPGIVIGHQLAQSIGVDVGDGLLLISPYGGPPTPLGPAPRLKRFRVVGIFESSFFQYDEVYTYVSLPVAQDFRRAGDVVDGVEARTTDFYRSQRVADGVRLRLDSPYYTRDWKEFFPAFFQALKNERVMMFVLLTMIMVVAAFVIVATLVMMIMEKSKDIAILKAMGATDEAIERIFALEGTLIGLAGTVLGVVAGVAVTDQLAWIQRGVERITGIDTLPASVYQFSTLPSQIDPVQVAGVVGIAMVLSLGATLLPSHQGAKLDPAEALRDE